MSVQQSGRGGEDVIFRQGDAKTSGKCELGLQPPFQEKRGPTGKWPVFLRRRADKVVMVQSVAGGSRLMQPRHLAAEILPRGWPHGREIEPLKREPAASLRLTGSDDHRRADVRGEQTQSHFLRNKHPCSASIGGFDEHAAAIGKVEAARMVNAPAADCVRGE